MPPSRFVDDPRLRARYGARLDRFATFLERGDPLADAAVAALSTRAWPDRMAQIEAMLDGAPDGTLPRELVALREATQVLPVWLDPERAARGGAVFMRAGLLGGLVLALRSIVFGYLSPAGNKPLVYSGRLEHDVPQRLFETSRFVRAVSAPGGIRLGAPGFRASVKVRLMHAEVRRMLSGSSRWDMGAWGVPINQADMCGTILLFSTVFVEGLALLGFRLGHDEAEDHLHLWRYVGFLMGVDPELLPATVAESLALGELQDGTQGPPDEDARRLARALIEAKPLHLTAKQRARHERVTPVVYALSRHLIGEAKADALGYPRDAWQLAPWALQHVMGPAVDMGRRLPLYDRALESIGERYWTTVAEAPRGSGVREFVMPEGLARA